MEVIEIVSRLLSASGKCSGHCGNPTSLKFLATEPMLIGCYVCSNGYVSRIVAYGKELDPKGFMEYVASATVEMSDVKDEDIRTATRYAWDLALPATDGDVVLKEAYWTQNYRRTKRDNPERIGLFVCSSCGKMFTQKVNSGQTLCPKCRAS